MDEIKNTYLTFNVGTNHFGIHVESIVEIVEYIEPKLQSSELPFMKGLIDYRGEIVPLIDTGLKFGLDAMNITDQTCCIIVAIKGVEQNFNVALVVDAVTEVAEIDENARQYIETSYKPGYVQFAAKVNDDFVMFLDSNKVFNDSEVISLLKITNQKA